MSKMKFTGWDKFKELKNNSIVKDKDNNVFKVIKEKDKMVYLEILSSPKGINNFIFKKIPIYWSTWEIIKNI